MGLTKLEGEFGRVRGASLKQGLEAGMAAERGRRCSALRWKHERCEFMPRRRAQTKLAANQIGS